MKNLWLKMVKFFTENMFITNFIIIAFLLLGFVMNTAIRREVAPTVEADAVHINIYHPTASAQEIEQDIIAPLEEVIQSFDVNIKYVSFANDSYGNIVAQLTLDDDISATRQRLIAALRSVPSIPNEARVVITEEGAQSIPMYYFSLQLKDEYSNQIDILQREASKLQREIKKISDIYTLETSGLLQKEIFVNVDPQKLFQYYISLQEIVTSLLRRNINASEGILNLGNQEKILVTDAGYKYPLDITNTILRSNFEKQAVSINDIATTEEGYEQANNDVFVNGNRAVFFGVRAKANANISQLTKQLDALLQKKQKTIPDALQISIVNKRSDSINTILDLTFESALISIFIVFIVLLMFLDWRTAFWTTASIPITISMLMITMYYSGITMNIITLCGIITALGMLVDHGIVISENIHHYRSLGHKSQDSIRLGVGEVLLPVFITVITTIVAFMPLLLIRDTIGNLIKPLPIVISLALVFSFFDAVFFLPTHLAHISPTKIKKQEKSWFKKVEAVYGKMLILALKFRYFVVLGFVCVLLLTVAQAGEMFKKFVFMEEIGVGSVYVNLEAPAGTSREKMKQLVNELTELVKTAVPPSERSIIKEEIGKYHILAFASRGFSPNKGQIAVYLPPIENRTQEYNEILSNIQNTIDNSPLKTNFNRIFYDPFGLIPNVNAALNMQFLQSVGSDSEEYITAMQEVFKYVENLDGVVNPEHTALSGKDQLTLQFDFDKMAQLGIDARIVSDTLKIAVSGIVPTTWRVGVEKTPYIVRLDPKYKNTVAELQELLIPNIIGRLIPLKEFTSVKEVKGGPDIWRSYGQRMVEIYIDVDPDKTTPTLISKNIQDFYQTIAYKYPNVDIYTGGDSVTISKAFEDFKLAFMVAGILIYIILLLLFREPLQPLIVLIAIPFGIIGAVWAFYLHNQVLSFMSLVGIVGLSGIVVNDAVVMVDFINKVVRNNKQEDIMPQIVEGATNRLKAVLLTTITTISGLLPSIYGLKGVADLIVPITTAIAYGLLFATILTPFFIPVLYMISRDIKTIFLKIISRNTSTMS